MKLVPLTVQCPQCGSRNVVYSCNPTCCFNHVCGDCYATFELATAIVGSASDDLESVPPAPDASHPTAPCVRCGECVVFMIEDGGSPEKRLLCTSCKTVLQLLIENISAA
ncbi:MAG TPA: hypothetical protein VMX16_11900 [Terriglobia bacterium]|nr:hypothetical protein [Terriglobia bacterium]